MANNQEEVKKFQSENQVEITGVLEKLEITETKKDGSPMVTKDGIPFKTARARIKVAEGEVHQVELMAMKHYASKPNEETNQWKAFNTYEADYISVEDTQNTASEHFGGTATVVSARAGIELNVYKNQAGKLQETTRLRGFFMNRVNQPNEEDFGADYTVTGVILADPRPEMKGEEETGRVLVDVGIIDYQNKAQPFTFVGEDTEDIQVTEFLAENLERGQTMTLNGKLINRYIVKEIEREGDSFGKKTVDVERDRKNEILIEGGLAPTHPDEIDFDEVGMQQKFVSPEQLIEAEAKWKQFVTEIESSSKKPATKAKKQTGFGNAGTSKKKSNPASDLDLPF